jgi:GYF domain
MSSSNTGGSLRPAWNRGNSKGFQPPPQVEQQQQPSRKNMHSADGDNRHNNNSNNNSHQQNSTSQRDNYNKFSALDIDDDDVVIATTTSGTTTATHTNATTNTADTSKVTATTSATTETTSSIATNSRSEGLRSTGRSLADLAARVPVERTGSRFSKLRTSSIGSGEGVATVVETKTIQPSAVAEEKVIRYTRERLLSLRPQPLPAPRELLKKELEGSLILSDVAQDPVCWDNLDTDKIWSTVAGRRGNKEDMNSLGTSGLVGGAVRRSGSVNAGPPSLRREASGNTGGGRWQRGVALPPEGSALTIGGSKQQRLNRDVGSNSHNHHRDAENPNDLWDDPESSGDGALMDFSAFGDTGGDTDGAFDFDKMAEASKKLEDELHGGRSRTSSNATNDDDVADVNVPSKTINPNRPLSTAGTTIRSGSGDHVNVFEDFDVPGAIAEDGAGSTKITENKTSTSESSAIPTIKAANEDPTASSRLMAMIGVKKDESAAKDAALTAWGESAAMSLPHPAAEPAARVSLNPWGDSILTGTTTSVTTSATLANVVPSTGTGTNDMRQHSLDLQARMRQAELEQQKLEENRRLQEELQRQRQQQEQEQERALVLQQQQQQAGVQSQVELVLMERISTILENSWGRSDLITILSTLHAEDPRVVRILSNIDALRALLMRNPRRVALRQDPSLRVEMVALLITNTQWHTQQQQQEAIQQQQALHHQQQQQQDELQRLAQQRRMEEQQAAAARAQQQPQIIPDAPWYYSDPSKNIQGPFRGEEMRQWLEAGYFKGDLPISQNTRGPFRPLSLIFTDLSIAFMNPKATELEEQQRREKAEHTRMEAEAAEREHFRTEEKRREKEAAAEKQRQQQAIAAAEAAATAEKARNSNGGNESSTQLKLMLGLGTPSETRHPNSKKAAGKGSTHDHQHNLREELPQEPSPQLDQSVPGVVKNAAPAWGGAAVSQPVTKKSMSEIQKEEARAAAAAVAAMNRPGAKQPSSGWANIAAAKGGSTAWSAGAAKPQPVAPVSTPSASSAAVRRVLPSRSVSLQPQSVASVSTSAATVVSSGNPIPGQVQRSSSAATRDPSDSADAFGAKMDPVLEKWCKDQMSKLNGTDDLTLVAFCMTLTDSEEIRQYLTAYLGSTPQVNVFATEFLQRKGGNQKKNTEEWESTATVKKGKKKKAGAH